MRVYVSGAAGKSDETLAVYDFNENSGELTEVQAVRALPKMSYLAADPDRNILYAVGSQDPQTGIAESYNVEEKDGRLNLELISRQPTLGANPNYVSISRTGSILYAANYAGESVTVLPIDEAGVIREASQHIRYEGSGPIPEKQACPHPHCMAVDPSGHYVVATDLGTDLLHVYQPDESGHKLREQGIFRALPGSGPRHLIFDPARPFAYVINELGSSISSWRFDQGTGTLELLHTVSTLPDGFQGSSKCADIQLSPCGKFLYGTNRGHDSIAIYRIGDKGELSLIDITPAQGQNPRGIALSPNGNYLLAANEKTGELVTFRILEDGRLQTEHQKKLQISPICILFAPSSVNRSR